MDAALGELPGVESYQLVQEGPEAYFCRFVVDPDADEAAARIALTQAVRGLYLGGTVTLQREEAIAPEPSGKYRLARTEVRFEPGSLF